jgi:hypothetical protein
VVYRCEGDFCPNPMAEILEYDTVKILSVVNGDLLWNFIATDDVLPKEFLDGGRGYVGNGLRFNPFGEVLHCDDSKSVVSLCYCKFAHDVNAPTVARARMELSTAKAVWGPQSNGRISGKLHKLIPVWLHDRPLPVSRNLADGP